MIPKSGIRFGKDHAPALEWSPSRFDRDGQAPLLIYPRFTYSSQACTTVCFAIRPFFSSSIAAQNTFVPSG